MIPLCKLRSFSPSSYTAHKTPLRVKTDEETNIQEAQESDDEDYFGGFSEMSEILSQRTFIRDRLLTPTSFLLYVFRHTSKEELTLGDLSLTTGIDLPSLSEQIRWFEEMDVVNSHVVYRNHHFIKILHFIESSLHQLKEDDELPLPHFQPHPTEPIKQADPFTAQERQQFVLELVRLRGDAERSSRSTARCCRATRC